jgi:NADH:ubiquinone oxidoreductase subunit B-like Fe-S oxidoreductase
MATSTSVMMMMSFIMLLIATIGVVHVNGTVYQGSIEIVQNSDWVIPIPLPIM